MVHATQQEEEYKSIVHPVLMIEIVRFVRMKIALLTDVIDI